MMIKEKRMYKCFFCKKLNPYSYVCKKCINKFSNKTVKPRVELNRHCVDCGVKLWSFNKKSKRCFDCGKLLRSKRNQLRNDISRVLEQINALSCSQDVTELERLEALKTHNMRYQLLLRALNETYV